MTSVVLRSKAIKGLKSASSNDRQGMDKVIDALRQGLFPLHTKKLGGVPNGYRTRVGRWRILFALANGEADIADIFLKKERGDYRRRK